MSRYKKLFQKILFDRADANVAFMELRQLLLHLGFEKRINGSHHTYRKEGILDKPNLQREGSKAKSYQVKQVRSLILKYNLGADEWGNMKS